MNIKLTAAAALAAGALAGCSSFGAGSTGSNAGTSAAPVVATSAPPTNMSMASQVKAWFTGVQTDWNALSTDNKNAGIAAGNGDQTGLATACGALKADVVRFEEDPAAPDPQLRADIARALDAWSTAATECLAQDYTDAGNELAQGSSFVDQATSRIEQLSSSGS